ncbi:hypothetical protein M8J77_019899 [Diaphorina citri]|nr:hypothetical protein M8J77_019899 [Diaphorina citri]
MATQIFHRGNRTPEIETNQKFGGIDKRPEKEAWLKIAREHNAQGDHEERSVEYLKRGVGRIQRQKEQRR